MRRARQRGTTRGGSRGRSYDSKEPGASTSGGQWHPGSPKDDEEEGKRIWKLLERFEREASEHPPTPSPPQDQEMRQTTLQITEYMKALYTTDSDDEPTILQKTTNKTTPDLRLKLTRQTPNVTDLRTKLDRMKRQKTDGDRDPTATPPSPTKTTPHRPRLEGLLRRADEAAAGRDAKQADHQPAAQGASGPGREESAARPATTTSTTATVAATTDTPPIAALMDLVVPCPPTLGHQVGSSVAAKEKIPPLMSLDVCWPVPSPPLTVSQRVWFDIPRHSQSPTVVVGLKLCGKGTCWRCGSTGHTHRECRAAKLWDYCYMCGRRDMTISSCPQCGPAWREGHGG